MATIFDNDDDESRDTWNDLVQGTDQPDTLYAGKGQNMLAGGGGIDTYVTQSHFALSTVVRLPDGSVRVGDQSLRDIELIQFRDVTLSIADALPHPGRQHLATGGADELVGDDFGYDLHGEDGPDRFTGLGGNDGLYGGKGRDTAVFRGERSEYRVLFDYTDRSVIVEDLQPGRDGRDRLEGIETLQFADRALNMTMTARYDGLLPEADQLQINGVIGTPRRPEQQWNPVSLGNGSILIDGKYMMTEDGEVFTVHYQDTAAPASWPEQLEMVGQPFPASGFQNAEP